MQCEYASSSVPTHKNNGLICMENSTGSFDNYEYCCLSGDYGADMPQCPLNENSGPEAPGTDDY